MGELGSWSRRAWGWVRVAPGAQEQDHGTKQEGAFPISPSVSPLTPGMVLQGEAGWGLGSGLPAPPLPSRVTPG